MFSVYILQSLKDKRTYVGFSDNVEKRLIRHNQGYINATKYRRPFKVLFTEKARDMQEAKKREKYWKSGAGRRKLKYYFENGFPCP
ncbi:MAG: GIY-YIG nuclease family protein [Patescibacteria group bacterium]